MVGVLIRVIVALPLHDLVTKSFVLLGQEYIADLIHIKLQIAIFVEVRNNILSLLLRYNFAML